MTDLVRRELPSRSHSPTSDAPAIRVSNLGKVYPIGMSSAGSLYDRLAGPLRHRNAEARERRILWALRGVSFEVPQGFVLGVLGRNGSGKSTLMKILARVTAPTEGSAELTGRLSALLQVGTGFHPELTGLENIALSGAILGMSQDEIQRVEPEIITFAEIGDFLDTPVKHYSSGMYMRLAFSVSAHMEADIMLLDEVLAVGDAAFQKKCHARIRHLVGTGRTVLFVSHQMASVKALCDAAIVLDRGRLVFDGRTDDATRYYNEEILKIG
jgi:lipopolysaccharide transport system ATP-binding protein